MEIFKVKLLFEIDIEGDPIKQFDEESYLVKEASERDAFKRATIQGIADAETFRNSKGKAVTWKFIGITELQPLIFENNMANICNKTLIPDDPRLFEESAIQKAGKLRQMYLHRVLN